MARPSAKSKKKVKRPAKKAQAASVASTSKPEVKEVVFAPIPDVITLTKQATRVLWAHKKLLGGIALVYGLLTLLLVRGFSVGSNVAELRDQFSSHLAGSVAAYFQLISNSGGSSSQSTGAYQFFLFVLVSLATIWALRQIYAKQSITVKQAYYHGAYPVVPFLLVAVVIMFQLLPVLIGVSVYQLVVVSGIAASTLEVALWGGFALATALVSLYFLASSIMALYIVTLPNMTPLVALKSARQLVKGRRWTILRKMLFFPLVALLAGGLIMTPFIMLAPVLAGWLLFALGVVMVVAGHTYFYNLYHGLLNEQQ